MSNYWFRLFYLTFIITGKASGDVKARLSLALVGNLCVQKQIFEKNTSVELPPLTKTMSDYSDSAYGEVHWLEFGADGATSSNPFEFYLYKPDAENSCKPSFINSDDNKDNIDHNIDETVAEQGNEIEGDILGYADDGRSGIPNNRSRWPNRMLNYTIGPNFNAFELCHIHKAIEELSAKTCITFQESTTGDFATYTKVPKGCSSFVGRAGGSQPIRLASSCFGGARGHGTAMHETIHALGFFHEQTRPDRDDYVIIHTKNINPEALRNFAIQNRSLTFDVPYDYGSIMHYSKMAFALNPGDITIEVKQKEAKIGQRQGLSPLDIQKLNRMYDCPQKQ